MKNRREFAISLAGALTAIPLVSARAAASGNDLGLKADLVPGHPQLLDFGDGLKIPMSKAAFNTLWEDKTFWITYGLGVSEYTAKAMGFAQIAALGTMKLLLLTLAFEPQRLDHVGGCGWTLNARNRKNYVLGDIAIPGKPFRPVTDIAADTASPDEIFQLSQGSMMGGSPQGGPAGGGNQMGVDITGTNTKVHAITGYIVWKKDVTLDYVRAHAQLL